MRVYINENPNGLDLARALGEVSSERRKYALRYRNELDRKLSVAAYLLLKQGLFEEYGIDGNPVLAVGENGKPYLPEHPEIHFNLSHCPAAAACAIGDEPVGIDVEEIAPVDWDVAEKVLSPSELADVRRASRPEEAFACYWTRKEALVKLRGEALDERRLPGLRTRGPVEIVETRVAANYVLSLARGGSEPRRREAADAMIVL